MTLYEKINKLAEKNGDTLSIVKTGGKWEISSYIDDMPLDMSRTYPYIKSKNLNALVNKALERCFKLEGEKDWDKWASSESDNPTLDDPDEQKELEYSQGMQHGEVTLEKGD